MNAGRIRRLRMKKLRGVAKKPEVGAAPEPPAPVVEAPAPAASAEPSADLSILDLSIAKLSAELGTGKHDSHLDALIEAEKADKSRKGAIAALEERKA